MTMTPRAYYNDNDKGVCAWVRELIKARLIMEGDVDERPIEQVSANDVRGYTRVHFFTGIAGWDYALQLAGWPADQKVFTASLPCQSFSAAGKGKGFSDHRGNLWFPFLRLVRECKPDTIFGEQVSAAIGHGWLDRIFTDLEAEGYTCGAAVLGAHSVGAPHVRQRLFWVAESKSKREIAVSGSPCEGVYKHNGSCGTRRMADSQHAERRTEHQEHGEPHRRNGSGRSGNTGGMGNPKANGCEVWTPLHREHDGQGSGQGCDDGGLDHTTSPRLEPEGIGPELREQRSGQRLPGERGTNSGVGDTIGEGLEGWKGQPGNTGAQRQAVERAGCKFWSDAIWHQCRDGKSRRISPKPALFPLSSGLPGRVGLLRGAGNAINAEAAAQFIRAYREI